MTIPGTSLPCALCGAETKDYYAGQDALFVFICPKCKAKYDEETKSVADELLPGGRP